MDDFSVVLEKNNLTDEMLTGLVETIASKLNCCEISYEKLVENVNKDECWMAYINGILLKNYVSIKFIKAQDEYSKILYRISFILKEKVANHDFNYHIVNVKDCIECDPVPPADTILLLPRSKCDYSSISKIYSKGFLMLLKDINVTPAESIDKIDDLLSLVDYKNYQSIKDRNIILMLFRISLKPESSYLYLRLDKIIKSESININLSVFDLLRSMRQLIVYQMALNNEPIDNFTDGLYNLICIGAGDVEEMKKLSDKIKKGTPIEVSDVFTLDTRYENLENTLLEIATGKKYIDECLSIYKEYYLALKHNDIRYLLHNIPDNISELKKRDPYVTSFATTA